MRRILLGLLAVATTLTLLTVMRSTNEAEAAPVEHCLVTVIATLDDGQMLLSDPVCVEDASEFAAMLGAVGAGESASAAIGGTARHYDLDWYAGSSLTVAGASCSGTWYYLPPSWENRVNSTRYDGGQCSRIRHYDWDAGRYRSTWPSGNLNSFRNRAEAIYYEY